MKNNKLRLKTEAISEIEGFESQITPAEQMRILGGNDLAVTSGSSSTTTPGTKGCATNVSTCWCNCSDHV